MAAVERRRCSKCEANRALRFFGPDARRADGLSTVCVSCKRTKRQGTGRNVRLQKTYGITLEDYQKILEEQGGVCGICDGVRKVFDVDHDHKTGIVRGLACRRCNRRLLPAAQDSVERLKSAIAYLENPPAIRAIGVVIVP